MHKKVTIIGLGTLGGFLSKNISELNTVSELVLIDYDIVEGKNTFKSIYNSSHIGEYKVNVLSEMINNDVIITKINQPFIEGITKIPKSDLVIDCRDVVCDRGTEIDVRLYITGRNLIIDCRKNVKNTYNYDGEYSMNLPKSEIRKAAFFASQILETGDINRLINNQMIQKIELNLLNNIMKNSIEKTLSNKIDMIYEATGTHQRLQCIAENIKPILDLNQRQDVEIFVGERTKSLEKKIIKFPKESKNKHAVLSKNSLQDSSDILNVLTKLIDNQKGVKNFIVTIKKKKGKNYVELLEETGAA